MDITIVWYNTERHKYTAHIYVKSDWEYKFIVHDVMYCTDKYVIMKIKMSYYYISHFY